MNDYPRVEAMNFYRRFTCKTEKVNSFALYAMDSIETLHRDSLYRGEPCLSFKYIGFVESSLELHVENGVIWYRRSPFALRATPKDLVEQGSDRTN